MTSSLYDPLGLVAPVTLIPKLLIQDLCRHKYDWDENIPDSYVKNWTNWIESLTALTELKIPRWLVVRTKCRAELHHFADASEIAYFAASYLKIYDANGSVTCKLLMGKSRLAPIKTMTIPRLELSAAVVAVKLHQYIINELDHKIDKSYFWSDSVSTLMYIRNTTRRFKTFVANRLAIIHEITTPSDWWYVPTAENPADMASRGIMPNQRDKLDYWLSGPNFLKKNTDFPAQPTRNSTNVELEIKEERFMHTVSTNIDTMDTIMNHCSDWFKLKRNVSWLLRYKQYLQRKDGTKT